MNALIEVHREEELARVLPFARPLFTVVVLALGFDLAFNVLSGCNTLDLIEPTPEAPIITSFCCCFSIVSWATLCHTAPWSRACFLSSVISDTVSPRYSAARAEKAEAATSFTSATRAFLSSSLNAIGSSWILIYPRAPIHAAPPWMVTVTRQP